MLALPGSLNALSMSNDGPENEMNILVLGHTGVGKSTWINAIANYITFDKLEDAAVRELIVLIPTKFHHTDCDLKQVLIETGSSTNECFDTGKSATKSPRAYIFEHAGCTYRIIDTPGIGDTDGIEEDKKNMENIMRFVARYKHIHAICILLPPNESKLTDTFKFCFKELLVQFHRNAAGNIIFCFTNTSGYGFRPQETLNPLQELLKEIKKKQNVTIELNRDRAYSFDNMAYRFICMYQSKKNIDFSDQEVELYKKSYEMSKTETERMLKFIRSIKPHNAKESLDICYVRKVVFCMTDPLKAISNAVQQSIDKIKEFEELVKNCSDNEKELRKVLMTKTTLVHWKMTEENHQFCRNCCYLKEYRGAERLKLIEADPSLQNDDPVKLWFAKEGNSPYIYGGTCPTCGPKTVVVNINKMYNTFTEEKEEEDVTVASQLKGKEEIKKELRQKIRTNETLKQALLDEQKKIFKACAQCAHFLQTYSITPWNDSTEDYLKMLIEDTESNGNLQKARSYKEMLKCYESEKKIFYNFKKMASGEKQVLKPAEMLGVLEELQKLKYYGKDIAAAIKMSQRTPAFNAKGEELEKHFRPKQGGNIVTRTWNYLTGN